MLAYRLYGLYRLLQKRVEELTLEELRSLRCGFGVVIFVTLFHRSKRRLHSVHS